MELLLREKKNGKEIKLNSIVSEIHVMFFSWIERGIQLDIPNLKQCMKLVLEKNNEFIKFCDNNIKKDVFILAEFIKDMSQENRVILSRLIYKCIDIYIYEMLTEKVAKKDNDLDYFKAVIGEYYIQATLQNNNDYNKFEKEFYQVGTIIGEFYSNKNQQEKEIRKNIINSKLRELFDRYNFFYSLPLCVCN